MVKLLVKKILAKLGYKITKLPKLNKPSISNTTKITPIYNPQNTLNSLFSSYPILFYKSYPKESLQNKRFYNVGAGSQKSVAPYWTHIDLPSDSYGYSHMDIAYDLESLEPLPIESNNAEIIYSNALLEHISWQATKNYIHESYRALKTGGIFHSKLLDFDYGVHLLSRNVIPRCFLVARESRKSLLDFLQGNPVTDIQKAVSFMNNDFYLTADNGKIFTVSPQDAFLVYNSTAMSPFVQDHPTYKDKLPPNTTEAIHKHLYSFIDPEFQRKYPHSHNSNYVSADMLMNEMRKAGFSEVYATQIGQSVSPVLTEPCFQNHHDGYSISIECIK